MTLRIAVRHAATVAAGTFALLVLTACGNLLEQFVPDTSPPSLSLSGVTDGTVVDTSAISFTAFAADDRAVTSVRFTTDGGDSGACQGVSANAYACGPVLLESGDNVVTVRARDEAGNTTSRSVSVRFAPPSEASNFDIVFEFFGEPFTASQEAAFYEAADRWERVIVGDLQDALVSVEENSVCDGNHPRIDEVVDDLLIMATSFSGAVGGLLGLAQPCLIRSGDSLSGNTTILGYMEFDRADLTDLESSGQLVEVIVHEMGHVIGIGTLWESPFGLLDFETDGSRDECRFASGFLSGPDYTGTNGVDAWSDLGGSGDVPAEDEGGAGTQCGHWDEGVFYNELMTGELQLGIENPLSELTVRSLEDLGLTVDATGADAYIWPPPIQLRSASTGTLDVASRERVLGPRGTIDVETGHVELSPSPSR